MCIEFDDKSIMGDGVPQDYAAAVKWFSKATEQADANADADADADAKERLEKNGKESGE
jgi:TPR repeat protein